MDQEWTWTGSGPELDNMDRCSQYITNEKYANNGCRGNVSTG